ncbi:unnamed protein product [Dibothriocephalus latus]|uniref:Uncharacterized protein n=1 Tax=Dibothriocephalus latus TaxID=60516 RepID=A0A3P6TYZ3_DIBLA|nr:unnamed protein product [Dibothriocephalus latus]
MLFYGGADKAASEHQELIDPPPGEGKAGVQADAAASTILAGSKTSEPSSGHQAGERTCSDHRCYTRLAAIRIHSRPTEDYARYSDDEVE